ncbi:RNA polymerase sigma factor [Gillisia limnaea]|uniref:RNA polymerase, sigma-24 subunit, ECF subfamily n=1 Tax=Gillisia limnaea (strain DSM 15749 / LMG 21470 / R-8282) TaxID=865937 RepID=H2BUQ2_GILLR|nr:RNA polymerase sigma-70 factor [Gillisia limnaea]EHQ01707.1 RNA polymerase, sigma-24 subunit, ECF subfamily [Gillisia limnaea DSM 15749]
MKTNAISISDQQLLTDLSNGNDTVFPLIFDRYWKRLYSYAYKIYRDDKVCEDIVQEIFISLWEKASESQILNLEAYLLRSVKYRVANHFRSLKFSNSQEEILENIPYPSNSVLSLEYQEFEKEVLSQVKKLPPRCREIFILSRFDNYSNSEIAEKLDISIRTVEKQISNALSYLKANLVNCHIAGFITTMLLQC